METSLVSSLLDRAREIINTQRSTVIMLGEVVYQLEQAKVHEGSGRPFLEYLEEQLDCSQGHLSRAKKIYQHYRVTNDVPVLQLEGIDSIKLYKAIETEGSVDEQLAKARTWSRDDFKEQKKDDCEKYEPIEVCKNCWATKEKHTKENHPN